MTSVFDAYAEYYDLIYGDKDYEAELSYVISLLAEQKITSGRVLELGCGTGQHAIALARAGFHVTGIDLSATMIAAAKQKIPVDLAGKLAFSVGDIRTFRTSETYDAVIALFHVASYLTGEREQDSLFSLSFDHLKEYGVLLFDYWHGPGVLNDLPNVRMKRAENDSVQVVRISEPAVDHTTNTVDVKFTVFVTDRAKNATSLLTENHKMRYLFVNEIATRANVHGLTHVQTNAWMTNRPVALKDWQAVTICKKEQAQF